MKGAMLDLGTLGSGLVIAGITGLTYLAYKHPLAYEKIYKGLILIIVLITFSGLALDWGRYQAYIDISDFLSNGDRVAARKVIDDGVVFDLTFVLLIGGFAIYLILLSCLPLILGKNNQEHKQGDEEGP